MVAITMNIMSFSFCLLSHVTDLRQNVSPQFFLSLITICRRDSRIQENNP
jgi:hypothetical protein